METAQGKVIHETHFSILCFLIILDVRVSGSIQFDFFPYFDKQTINKPTLKVRIGVY